MLAKAATDMHYNFANRGDAGVVHDVQGYVLKAVSIFLFDTQAFFPSYGLVSLKSSGVDIR